MVSNRFAIWMVFRVVLLTVTLSGLSLALTTSGYYAVTLLLTIVALTQIFELNRFISKTNNELCRFLDAARYQDFSQHFHNINAKSVNRGAGFDQLAIIFESIMQNFKNSRQQQEETLRHLKSLTEHIPVPLLSLHPDGRIQLHNNSARHLFANEKINKIEDLAIFSQNFLETIKNIQPGERQLANFCCEGMQRQLTIMMTQVITGTITENLISLQDIQSELDSAQLQAWQDLVRVLTHEMMNSITPIASLAKTASSDLVDDVSAKLNSGASVEVVLQELEDVRRAVDTVARRSEGLMQFVQSYRSLTQLPVPQKRPLKVKQIFQDIRQLFATEWKSQGISLIELVEPEELQLYADPDLIEQVLINLMKNAEQAFGDLNNSAIASPQVKLIGRVNQRGYLIIEVEDNGPGISEDIRKEIFLPFYTTKRQGSGVGLALTRQIMIAHGGNVTLNASNTGGATFSLFF